LPGLDDEPKGFLAQQTWIDLRAGTDDPSQLQNLIAAIHREAPESDADMKAAICPYRGLLPFREEDAAFFFGRDGWIGDLTAKVQVHPLVAVVGRSGSGKSSLVFAGLFPALRKTPSGTIWEMLAIRPGREPLNALAEALSPPPDGATPAERIASINADADRLRRGTVRLDQLVRHYVDQQPGTDRLLLYSISGRSCTRSRRVPRAAVRHNTTRRTLTPRRRTPILTSRASSICCWPRLACGTAR
jgi:hypothetical protein